MQITAPAKLNLCLDIIKREPSGFHQIQTIFCTYPKLSNAIKIKETPEPHDTSIAQPHQLARRAVELIRQKFQIKKPLKITIDQKIPFSSGLGGASSDAAAILKALNQIWSLSLTQSQLLDLAAELGSDVPFFILDTPVALGTNYGEKVQPLPSLPESLEFQVYPQSSPDHNKTATQFAALDLSKCGQNTSKTQAFIQALHDQDHEALISNLHNDFETLTPPPQGHHLSGSGPSTFSLC